MFVSEPVKLPLLDFYVTEVHSFLMFLISPAARTDEEKNQKLVLLGGFLNAAFFSCWDADLQLSEPRDASWCWSCCSQRVRKRQERLKASLPGSGFCMPEGHKTSGFSLLPCHSKLDFPFGWCLTISIRTLTGVASNATEMNAFQGRTLRLLDRNGRWNTWQGAAEASSAHPLAAAGGARYGEE